MFDIGWMELMVIGIVALIVVGPKDLPGLFRAAGQFMGKARGMAREFQRSMEAAADETGLGEAGRQLEHAEPQAQPRRRHRLRPPLRRARRRRHRRSQAAPAPEPARRPSRPPPAEAAKDAPEPPAP